MLSPACLCLLCVQLNKSTVGIPVVGEILNTKRCKQGQHGMSGISFYKRVQQFNCRKQDLGSRDMREAIQVKWLIYSNQKKEEL